MIHDQETIERMREWVLFEIPESGLQVILQGVKAVKDVIVELFLT